MDGASWWVTDPYRSSPAEFYARLATDEERGRLRRINAEIVYATLAQDMEKRRRRLEAAKEC